MILGGVGVAGVVVLVVVMVVLVVVLLLILVLILQSAVLGGLGGHSVYASAGISLWHWAVKRAPSPENPGQCIGFDKFYIRYKYLQPCIIPYMLSSDMTRTTATIK